ncbi:YhjD/YihY/BrkB family envelope integrity protein [Natrarchaeobius oligotrophus]|uniref:YihY family inner membrane protein n=1 Tax=Natrarchaeobius chitinivorans TaxID=1679083 RepID=A0A3N6PN81_NATCH|nr:YhjD/YihY/BrkB family envelope integrity protein [Natrarchaeobius chitinivorans]RQH03150.1 YihY family inner membrane protein [Natrarchaeobius chitinivorans]
MTPDVGAAVSSGKTVVAGIQEKNVPFMAASIAYQAFISLIPLLVLVFFFVTIVGDEQFAAEVTAATEGFLPQSGQVMVENAIEDSPATAGSTLIGLVVVAWGALKLFRGLDTAFSEIYDSSGENSFLEQLRDAAIVLGGIAFALAAAGLASVAFALFPDVPLIGLVNPIVLVVGLTLAFYPMYYFFPDVDVTAREVLPGVVVAAVGWTVLQSLFQVYVAVAAGSEAAGPVGAILLLLTWLYFGGLILLVGAVVNATRSDRLAVSDASRQSKAGGDRSPYVDGDRLDRERLVDRISTLERERDQLRNDREAQRQRRYRLEDRVDALEETVRELEATNEGLRRTVEARRRPRWKRTVDATLSRVQRLRIGRITREQ